MNQWVVILRLCRISNIFTLLSDVTAAYLVASLVLEPAVAFVVGLVSSALIYCAGMVLNDVFDVEIDRAERPDRPIPSGKISLGFARILGFGMLLCGLFLINGFELATNGAKFSFPLLCFSLGLAGMVVGYNALLKHTMLGPIAMGSCRGLNILMIGALAANHLESPMEGLLGLNVATWMVAAGMTLYISGVTIFAKKEAEESPTGLLVLGMGVMIGGVAMLGFIPFVDEMVRGRQAGNGTWFWPTLLALIASVTVRRGIAAVQNPSPRRVQMGVISAIRSLIFLDGALCFLVRPDFPYIAFGVVLLIVPATILGKWFKGT